MGESPYSIPVRVALLAEISPQLAIMVARSGVNRIPGNDIDVILLGRPYDNVYLGANFVQTFHHINMLYEAGHSKLFYENDWMDCCRTMLHSDLMH